MSEKRFDIYFEFNYSKINLAAFNKINDKLEYYKEQTYESYFNNYKELNFKALDRLIEENNLKVHQSLKFLLTKNIFFINKNDFYNVLKTNNLIEYFYIKKIYPDLIKIIIKQTDFLAKTTKNNKIFYIGSNGKLIHTSQIDSFNNKLPFVYTKGNYIDFIKLK